MRWTGHIAWTRRNESYTYLGMPFKSCDWSSNVNHQLQWTLTLIRSQSGT